MSVVVVTRDDYASISRTVQHVAAQSEVAQIELIIVAPETVAVPDDVARRFYDVAIVAVGPIDSRGHAAAAGVARASAPLVVFAENHAFPQPGWARALIGTHEGDWAGVGPQIENDNPHSETSRAMFAHYYGQWSRGGEAREMDATPFHATCYRRDLLTGFGGQLGSLLEREERLQRMVREAGGRLCYEPAARVRHINAGHVSAAFATAYHFGRIFGAGRAVGWSFARRLAYIAGSPLIPVLNLPRMFAKRRLAEAVADSAASRLLMMLVVLGEAIGEVVGYALGPGESRAWVNNHEFEADSREKVAR